MSRQGHLFRRQGPSIDQRGGQLFGRALEAHRPSARTGTTAPAMLPAIMLTDVEFVT